MSAGCVLLAAVGRCCSWLLLAAGGCWLLLGCCCALLASGCCRQLAASCKLLGAAAAALVDCCWLLAAAYNWVLQAADYKFLSWFQQLLSLSVVNWILHTKPTQISTQRRVESRKHRSPITLAPKQMLHKGHCVCICRRRRHD